MYGRIGSSQRTTVLLLLQLLQPAELHASGANCKQKRRAAAAAYLCLPCSPDPVGVFACDGVWARRIASPSPLSFSPVLAGSCPRARYILYILHSTACGLCGRAGHALYSFPPQSLSLSLPSCMRSCGLGGGEVALSPQQRFQSHKRAKSPEVTGLELRPIAFSFCAQYKAGLCLDLNGF